jgi:hypothetical protein
MPSVSTANASPNSRIFFIKSSQMIVERDLIFFEYAAKDNSSSDRCLFQSPVLGKHVH